MVMGFIGSEDPAPPRSEIADIGCAVSESKNRVPCCEPKVLKQ